MKKKFEENLLGVTTSIKTAISHHKSFNKPNKEFISNFEYCINEINEMYLCFDQTKTFTKIVISKMKLVEDTAYKYFPNSNVHFSLIKIGIFVSINKVLLDLNISPGPHLDSYGEIWVELK